MQTRSRMSQVTDPVPPKARGGLWGSNSVRRWSVAGEGGGELETERMQRPPVSARLLRFCGIPEGRVEL